MSKLQVFIDGACYLCHFEGRLIRRADKSNRIEIVNIASSSFKKESYPDRPYETYLQIRMPNGEFLQGVQAFSEIYKLLPRMRIVGVLIGLPIIRHILWIPYFLFAHGRKWLPQRKDCEI